MLERYERSLTALTRRHRRRELSAPSGVDFSSNDYLALSGAPELREAVVNALDEGAAVGAGASRLLRGNHREHEALEAEAARFFGAERALYFASGYSANAALLSTLPRSGDLVLYDERIHASVHDGLRGARFEARSMRHSDPAAYEAALRDWRKGGGTGQPWLVIESLYSMDGDQAPLAALAEIARRYDAFLIVDEAHATGVFGLKGRGLSASLDSSAPTITVHTCGKALGVSGALVCGPATIIDFLINRCSPFIYATAPSPLIAVAVRRALRLLDDEPERPQRLLRLIEFANHEAEARCGVPPSGSQILPVILGRDARAARVAAALQAEGYDVRAIRPPTVPEGTARLRISLTLHVNETLIADMLDTLAGILEREGA